MADWPYLTNWSSDLDFQGHVIFIQYWKKCLLDTLFFLNQIVDIRIMITSSTVHEIWLIDPIWPTLSSGLHFQGHVIFRQYWQYVCWIPCSLKPYSRHVSNNDYIVYGLRDMGWLTIFDQFCQVTLTYKVTWSSGEIENMFFEFSVPENPIIDIKIIVLSRIVLEILRHIIFGGHLGRHLVLWASAGGARLPP